MMQPDLLTPRAERGGVRIYSDVDTGARGMPDWRRRWWWMVLGAAVGLIAGAIFLGVVTPRYTVAALLMAERTGEALRRPTIRRWASFSPRSEGPAGTGGADAAGQGVRSRNRHRKPRGSDHHQDRDRSPAQRRWRPRRWSTHTSRPRATSRRRWPEALDPRRRARQTRRRS